MGELVGAIAGLAFAVFVVSPACKRMSDEQDKYSKQCIPKCAPYLVDAASKGSCICSARKVIKK